MRIFDSKQNLYVTKGSGIKYNGKNYPYGSKLDTLNGLRDIRVLRIMYDQRRISHIQPDAVKTVIEPIAPVIAAVAAAPSGDRPGAVLVHTGAGWYNVEVYGTPVNLDGKLKGEQNARDWAENNGFEVLTQ